MTAAAEYRDALRPLLEAASTRVSGILKTLAGAANIPGIDGVVLDVYVGQDPEGPFDIWARFAGPRGTELDFALGDARAVFGVEWSETGWDPGVPPCPAGWSLEVFEAAVLAAVAEWIDPLIPAAPADLEWTINSPEGLTDSLVVGAHRG